MTAWIISGWIHFIVGIVAMYFARPYIDKAVSWLTGKYEPK